MSEIFWETVEHFNKGRGHLLTADIIPQFIQQQGSRYAESLLDKGAGLENYIGFIEGTVIGVARSGGSAIQNAVYTGHKKKHALKFQVVMSPDGLVLHAHGPVEGRRHDWTLYIQSEMDRQLEEVLDVNGKQFCIYGDSGYNYRVYLEVPFQVSVLSDEAKAYNKALSKVRVCVDWIFMEVKLHWSAVDFKRKMRIKESPVGLLYRMEMIITNIRNCIYPNTVAKYFDCAPPLLEQYFSHRDEQVNVTQRRKCGYIHTFTY